jgi:predicted unusual protein kinase regulating ubiquinone biosynthesis (AarF/ABC1/UbiB family)
MLNLCLSLRGFFLKSGQFLGTRHDFMPDEYTLKLSQLHDDVPPLSPSETRAIVERELGGEAGGLLLDLDFDRPVGSASIAQVHRGVWAPTSQRVAVKVQNPCAERLMRSDLKSLVALARFLQKTEIKFDLLSALCELQKQIGDEFDFIKEASSMDRVGKRLMQAMPGRVAVPTSVFRTKKLLVMTFVDGDNLSKLKEFRNKLMPGWMKKRAGYSIIIYFYFEFYCTQYLFFLLKFFLISYLRLIR